MESLPRTIALLPIFFLFVPHYECAKINTPRVLLPWLESLKVNFTFEIIEGGCYTWTLSRDDIIDLEALYEDSWGHCSHAARVSVSKSCTPPGTVIILAEEVNNGEILRGDVDIDKISYLKVTSTTWKLYLEEAPEAFEVVAYDDQGNTFSTLEGVSFDWSIENLGNSIGEDPLVTLVQWRDTDYEAPRGVAELEAKGLRSHSALLYGQAMGESKVTVCLVDICTDFTLKVVASVVLTPAVAVIAPGDTLRYKVVRARAGRLTVQDISDTLYYMKLPQTSVAQLEDTISLVRGSEIGTTSILLMSGVTEVATATLIVSDPHHIRVTLKPANLLIKGDLFTIHCVVFDESGHALTAGDEMLIRLTAEGEANVDLLRSNKNGTVAEAVAQNAGHLTITARLYSVAGNTLSRKVEGKVSAIAVDPLEVVPPELFVAYMDTIRKVTLRHRGGGDEVVTWSESETASNSALSLTPTGEVNVRGEGDLGVRVHLKKYPYVRAIGRVYSIPPELLQVASSGSARVGRPHQLHVALAATHPLTGDLFNFHRCDCGAFAVSLLEGPEPQNVTNAHWITPMEGACCVVECTWVSRGVSTVRVSRGRAGDTARVLLRAPPALLWPPHAAALLHATLPVLAEGESLVAQSSDGRIAELTGRDGPPPFNYPDVQLFTLRCGKKGDARLVLSSVADDQTESVDLEIACATHVSRVRLEPSEASLNCSQGPKVWLQPGREVMVRVTLLDAIGRELLDERGPKVAWGVEPHHGGIEFRASDRLFIETHPDFAPVTVPYKYYQLVVANDKAIGWSGVLKANIPDATASIQAKVVAPLIVDPVTVNVAWEGESISNVASVRGGSGRYAVETRAGSAGSVQDGALSLTVPGPGAYDVQVLDLCVGERQTVEVQVEEILNVEVLTARAVGVGACVPIQALVKGVSHRYLSASETPEWRFSGYVQVKDDLICGLKEGTGRVRAAIGGVWSNDAEILVFPPLEIIPSKSRLPPGARIQLRHKGGPPSHLASLQYRAITGLNNVEVSPSGALHGLSLGTSRIKLVATDIGNVEMDSAEAEVEVIPITGLRVRSATQTLLVGSPCGVWVEAVGLSAASLGSLHPPPRVTYTVRDPKLARLYTTYADDQLERSVAEGLSVRVVPLKPGLITIDVRVRNMGQVAETRTWDSTIEILAISDIRTSVEGLPKELIPGDRLAIALGSVVRLKSLPKGEWNSYGDSFELTSNGEVRALKTGHGIIVAQHRDERNNIYRETAIHVEVSKPHYCTAEPSGDEVDPSIRLALRSSTGRRLLAPMSNVSVVSPHVSYTRRPSNSVYGAEVVTGGMDGMDGMDAAGAFMSFQCAAGGVTVTDDVWVAGDDTRADRVVATAGWAVCLEGVGWRTPPGVSLYPGSSASLALLTTDVAAKHVLRQDRPHATHTIHQLPVHKIEFLPGEWPYRLVPLSIEAIGLNAAGPLLCQEDQKYALEGLQVELPFTCRTKQPHSVEPVLDILHGQIGCSIIPAVTITEPSEIELCAEWDAYRTCTKVPLLPNIKVSATKLSLQDTSTGFIIFGHPQTLRQIKITNSPGLKIETKSETEAIEVTINNEGLICGIGWVNVISDLTSQDIRVEVDRECDVTCGTLLGAIFALVRPYLSTIVSIIAVAAGILFLQTRLQQKANMTIFRTDPNESVLPRETTPPLNRSRTWARSPYATNGPITPIYGDTSVLPDASYSPNSTQMHSRFL